MGFSIWFQVVRYDRLLCGLQQSNPSLRDGDASKKQCLPFGVFRMPTVQPQVLSPLLLAYTYTQHATTTAGSHQAILITLKWWQFIAAFGQRHVVVYEEGLLWECRATPYAEFCGNCASINPLMRLLIAWSMLFLEYGSNRFHHFNFSYCWHIFVVSALFYSADCKMMGRTSQSNFDAFSCPIPKKP